MNYLVYSRGSEPFCPQPLAAGLTFVVWRPSLRRPIAPTMGNQTLFWMLFHYFQIFRNREYAVLFIKDGERIIHRSCVVPTYFRWPFMKPQDLQISSTWTDPDYRNRGLATSALMEVLRVWALPGRTFWYVTREDNKNSISVCERGGFTLEALAKRTYFLGSRVLGKLSPRDHAQSISGWYRDYYERLGPDRNDLRLNKGVLMQILAMSASVVRAIRAYELPVSTSRVLDVGCGSGANLFQVLMLGFRPQNVTGIDIIPERIEEAKAAYPQADWVVGNAGEMAFPDAHFDLVFEFTMFATIPDDALSAQIARQMIRVCKPGAYLMLVDWRTHKPNDVNYLALTRSRLNGLFEIGRKTELVGIYNGALIPPVGRTLSTYFPSLYFLVSSFFPFLVGQVVYLLRKKAAYTAISSRI